MADPILIPETVFTFADEARRAVYDAIALRRDVRHFRPETEIEEGVLERVLAAAHLAPSVGFSQPWGFIVVRDRERRGRRPPRLFLCPPAAGAPRPPRPRGERLPPPPR